MQTEDLSAFLEMLKEYNYEEGLDYQVGEEEIEFKGGWMK